MDAPPTVDRLCATFLRIATWYTAPWCDRYPHLRDEFHSAAGEGLFSAARAFVAKGPDLWERMRFAVWLKIAIVRDCQAVVAKEQRRHPVGFLPQGGDEAAGLPGRERPADEAVADDEARHADLGRVAELLDLVVTTDDQELILRFYIDGDTIADMARERGSPHSTVQTRIARALKWLRFAAGTGSSP